ncbi:peptidase [Pseudomonas amygdali pv. tabaci str. ATCC 11528]|uniref:Peptidase propeptide and YPEB domain protein n=26 Tax=Pseudomonas syringae group TaxID=136849 RepID=A0A0Q0BET8_PSEAJ|nr:MULTISPECIES: PepSY domain-containing protein [Pseudomonas]KPB84446.1 Peptidase propeptide and YPEB domain protein [Pseudomonas syringae pv. maculicola]KPX02066.1 Peptidase propeptide and YPEB domain protein [Pseudomonas syringae pv. cunninghamiae]AAZ35596.1 peptidase propeptide and YPEB domain protein [Pseudomonas savastanoi pv. phaseolicola 1448A]ARA80698.1 peptidase [Pseudomonas amygdali pv. lachrymans]ARD11950.1 peptidase [Pseudomonas savastanoi pv. savastanoi NCPPB 3335]
MNVDKRLCVILGLSLTCSFVYARDLNQDEALSLRQRGVILPLEQFIERALGLHPGARLLEAELEEKNNMYVYEFELLTPQGVVRELKFDARDSRLLKDEDDD